MTRFNPKLRWPRNAFLSAICGLLAVSLTQGTGNRSGLARAGVGFGAYEADMGRFPLRGSLYESTGGTGYPSSSSPVSIELVSLSLQSASPLFVELPQPGTGFVVDSFFDIYVDLRTPGGDFRVDSFFDIVYRLDGQSGGPTTAEVQTEMIQMELHGDVPGGPTGSTAIFLRESPSLSSTGHHSIRELPGGTFQVDSFFDIWTELSIDGGQNWIPSENPVRVELTAVGIPEPASLMLAGVVSLFGLIKGIRCRWKSP